MEFDNVFDIAAGLAAGLFTCEVKPVAVATAGPTLNALMKLGKGSRVALRKRLSQQLAGRRLPFRAQCPICMRKFPGFL